MTRTQFNELAQEMLETLDSIDEIVKSTKEGTQLLRIQITDAVQALEENRDACMEDCAHKLAAQIKKGGQVISLVTDNWSSASRI